MKSHLRRSASSAAARRSGVHSESRSRRSCASTRRSARAARRSGVGSAHSRITATGLRCLCHMSRTVRLAHLAVKLARSGTDKRIVIAAHKPAQGGGTALDALIDAAAGILAADSLEDTLARIAHHLQALLPYDDLTVYEVDAEGTGLRPVFALGMWVERDHGRDALGRAGRRPAGWCATAARATCPTPASTTSAPSCRAPTSTPRRSSACRCSPMTASSATLNVYRVGADRAFTDAEVALVERFATMAALAYDSARQRDTLREQAAHRRPHRAAQPPRRAGAAAARDRAPPRPQAARSASSSRPRPLQAHQRLATATPRATRRSRAAAAGCARSSARATPSAASAARSSCSSCPASTATAAAEAAERARAALGDVAVGGRPLDVLRGRRHVPGRRDARRRAAARARRRRALRRQARRPRPDPPLRRATSPPARRRRRARRDRGAAAPARGRDPSRSSSPCSSSPPAASAGYEALARIPDGPSAGPTSGSPRRTAPVSAPR